MVPDGGNYLDLPQELWSTRKVHIAWTRMDSAKPCFTIDTGHNHHFHYKEELNLLSKSSFVQGQISSITVAYAGNKLSSSLCDFPRIIL